MSPELKSVLTSVLLALATGAAGWFVHSGIIRTDDQPVVINAIVAIVTGVAAVGVGWYKRQQVTPTALIAAVNKDETNGVKVVPNTSPTPAVNAPIKPAK